MRTYIELRNLGGVLDWRVIEDENDATIEAIAKAANGLLQCGLDIGDSIVVYESDKTAAELKLPGARQ